ncbi:hypothetical protein BDK51DRAFT_48068 [Blyttiomyces helicus]|uniref:Uncharacterized protein n=1 Tax=Blyttiomyces helicus TaxID=388810 RepID=A0A4P9VYQ5_9FUNG|nr:hypothetical protein BDK51DRAFT_48068 [Blyttiomyces helicus]|eukprot:RKO82926.1 hypothetical protein BDK51DRAFT_48068 [Blyttiomyces helicus]
MAYNQPQQGAVVARPLKLHIYRDGWFSNDVRITFDDKTTVAYHVDKPRA